MKTVPAGPGKTVPAGPGRVVVAGGGKGHWRTYDSTSGLLGGHVLSMLQDREGYLWFGTTHGLSRYDGHVFTGFTTADGLANNWVWSILQDREGHLWFGTKGGASRYNGKAFTTFTAQDGLANNEVKSIFQDREGHLWFGTSGGVSRYDGKAFTTFTSRDGLAGDSVSSVLQTPDGDLWFGIGKFGPASGVSRYDGRAFTTFTTQDGLANNDVKSIFQDRERRLWFATPGGASRYDRKTPSTSSELALPVLSTVEGSETKGQAFTTFTTRDGLANNDVLSVFQDREGHLWFATHGGVSRYDGQDWITFTIADGLATNLVWSILQDQEGGFWFCTSGGVSRYDDQTLIAFTPEDGLPDNVFWILQDREKHLWFSSQGGGVSRYDGEKLTIFTTRDGLSDNVVQPIFQDREGHLWFGTINGLSRYDGQTFTTFTTQDGLADNHVQGIFQDRDGVLWVGTVRGLNRYDGQTFTTFTTQDGLGDNYVWSISQDRDGVLWFGTAFNGVSRYDGQSFTTFTAKDGLVHESVISDIFQDRAGYLWFGTQGGVSRYDPSTGSGQGGKGFTNFTTQDGLAADGVRSILQDQEGHLWFGTTGGGVSRFDGQVFQTLTRQDGLTGNVVYAIFQDPEGNLWFGASGGVTRYRPSAPSPPPVVMDAVVADRRYEGAAEVEVPSAVRLTAFEFHGMSLKTRPDGMVYRYRLKGHDADWRTTRQRRVEYEDLSAGEYTFEVAAVDRDLVYSDKPATVRLTVAPDLRVEALTEALSRSGASGEFIGTSEALRRVQRQLSEVAGTDETVLILGETGTGKGLAARAVHALNERRAGPFIQVNCGAIPEGLVESELFGHEKGAFTGAISRKLGKVEVAEGGTLFLDEIGDTPIEAQVKLLRLLEERTFERVGGTQTLKADVRVVAATNRDLKQMVAEGKFREDLYFRLQVFPVRVPPLRERREDIPVLAAYFVERMAAHLNKPVSRLTQEALDLLKAYDWPGNVRELEHAVRRAVIVCRGPVVRASDILLEFGKAGDSPTAEEETVPLEEHERRYIQAVLEKTGGIIKGPRGAAALLGLHEATLRSRMKKLGIRKGRNGV